MRDARVVVIGGGHNGLVCAAYLARRGIRVTLLERRDRVGGACVTEELWPGYRVSRAAYVVSLFRPRILRELELERFGLTLLPRSPASLTPLADGRSLVLGVDPAADSREIARFSPADAALYPRYEALLERIARAFEPTLDLPPPELRIRHSRGLRAGLQTLLAGLRLGRQLPAAAQLLLGAARDVIEEWFESEPLRTTLASDAVIGAYASPSTRGTGYVLFHHVMGSIGGKRGVWAYVRGGMGSLTQAIAACARSRGVTLRCEAEVARIRVQGGRATGVVLADGEEIPADAVVSGADPARSFALVEDPEALPDRFRRALDRIDYRSPVAKINLALRRTPRFRIHDRSEVPLSGTIHLGPRSLDELDEAFDAVRHGRVSPRPLVELTLPSVLDASLAPDGCHVASIFTQYLPALPKDDPAWPGLRDEIRDRVLAVVEEAAPGFQDSIESLEVLAAPDLERIFGLTGGNIFHGAMTPDRLLMLRPLPGWSHYRTPLRGLYLCGSGTHPGGGVMGAPGRNAAFEIAHDLRRRR